MNETRETRNEAHKTCNETHKTRNETHKTRTWNGRLVRSPWNSRSTRYTTRLPRFTPYEGERTRRPFHVNETHKTRNETHKTRNEAHKTRNEAHKTRNETHETRDAQVGRARAQGGGVSFFRGGEKVFSAIRGASALTGWGKYDNICAFFSTHQQQKKKRYKMGTGRTLRKESHVRPCKTPAGKARKNAAQRRRLVKFGLSEEAVGAMGDEEVRVLVQRPAVVAKLAARA